jgi:hypothetical protein
MRVTGLEALLVRRFRELPDDVQLQIIDYVDFKRRAPGPDPLFAMKLAEYQKQRRKAVAEEDSRRRRSVSKLRLVPVPAQLGD